jgi:hypothetical protein
VPEVYHALAYSNLMRWKGHLARGEPIHRQPGPAKGQGLDLAHLEKEIQALGHRRKRSAGAEALWKRCQHQISRRRFGRLIAEIRSRERRKDRDALQRINWRAGLVWRWSGRWMASSVLQRPTVARPMCMALRTWVRVTNFRPWLASGWPTPARRPTFGEPVWPLRAAAVPQARQPR